MNTEKPKKCGMCGNDIPHKPNVVCFYPYDKTKDDVTHADPYVNFCDSCFTDLRNVVAMQMAITTIISRENDENE